MQKTWPWTVTGYQFVDNTFEEVRDICIGAGIAGIEGSLPLIDGKSEAEVEAAGQAYTESELKVETFHLPFGAEDDIASFYETARRQAVDRTLLWMERASHFGATVGIQHPSTSRCSVDVEGLDPYVRQISRSLESLLPAAERLGFTIAIENMLPSGGGRFGSRPEHFKTLVREFGHPCLGFCLDTGHALVAGGPEWAGEFFEVMAPHLVAYHLADNAGDRDSHLAPGRGLVDWTTVFRQAAKIGYDGTMCIETPPFAHGPNYSMNAWKALVEETETLAAEALRP